MENAVKRAARQRPSPSKLPEAWRHVSSSIWRWSPGFADCAVRLHFLLGLTLAMRWDTATTTVCD
jgi:hypothetical protein